MIVLLSQVRKLALQLFLLLLEVDDFDFEFFVQSGQLFPLAGLES